MALLHETGGVDVHAFVDVVLEGAELAEVEGDEGRQDERGGES